MNKFFPTLGVSHLMMFDNPVKVLQTLMTSWTWMTTAVVFRGVMVAQLYRMVELMNPGKNSRCDYPSRSRRRSLGRDFVVLLIDCDLADFPVLRVDHLYEAH